MITMKTFNDLDFEVHNNITIGFATHARLDFDNGHGISVITGYHAYGEGDTPYEAALFSGGHLAYDDDLFVDVVGHCDEDAITKLMAYIQEKPAIVEDAYAAAVDRLPFDAEGMVEGAPRQDIDEHGNTIYGTNW